MLKKISRTQPLGVVLRVLRVVGMCPFIITSHGVRISRGLVVYGWIFNLMLGLAFLTVVVTYVIKSPILVRFKGSLALFDVLSIALLILLGAIKASCRLSKLIQGLTKLNQVSEDITKYTKLRSKRSNETYFTIYMIIGLTLNTIFVLYVMSHVLLGTALYLICFVHSIHPILTCLYLERAYAVDMIHSTLVEVYEGLVGLKAKCKIGFWKQASTEWTQMNDFQEIRSPISIVVRPQNAKRKKAHEINNTGMTNIKYIRHLAQAYGDISDTTQLLVGDDGAMLVALTFYMLMKIMLASYYVIVDYHELKGVEFMFSSMWLVLVFGSATLFVDIYHRANTQIEYINEIILELKYRASEEAIINELDLFSKLLLLNRPTFRPLGLFTISRSLVTKILGCTVSYLIISIDFSSGILLEGVTTAANNINGTENMSK